MVKVNANPLKFGANVLYACFYYRETQPITFDGLDLEGRLTMLKFARKMHVMIQTASAHRSNKMSFIMLA